MRILATQYTLSTKSLEIYVAGCNGQPHCKNCHNPESWNFNNGDLYTKDYLSAIKEKIADNPLLIKNIMIFGGEPLDQNKSELFFLLKDLKLFNLPIWIFTRYDITEIYDFVKEYCDYIKCGRYIEELKTDDNIQYGIKLATSNQKIYKKGVDY